MNDPRAKSAVVVANLGEITFPHHPCHLPQPKSWSKSCNVHNTAWWLWRPRAICGKYGTKARATVALQDPTFWIWIFNSPGVATSFNNPYFRYPLRRWPFDSLLFYKSTNLNKPHTQQHDCQPQWLFAFCGACCRAWCITWAQFSSPVSCTICNSTAPRSSRCSWRSESFFDVGRKPHTKKKWGKFYPWIMLFLKIMGWCF